MDKTRLGVFIVYIAVAALLGLSVGMFWALKLFDFAGTDASAQVIAASIAAVGVFFTAMGSLVGLLFRWSVDRGRLLLEQQSHEQRKIEMDATNKRLDMEASMKAVELFKTASGSATPAERAGALFALSGLGKHAFSMTLLNDLVAQDKVTANSAVYHIDEALAKGDSRAQQLAAEILQRHAATFSDGETWWWPDHITYQWMPELDEKAKLCILWAFLKIAIRQLFSPHKIGWSVGWLARLLVAESDEKLKHNAAYALNVFLKVYPESHSVEDGKGGRIDKARMQALAEKESGPVSVYIDEIALQLEAWIKGESVAREESAPQEPPSGEAPEEN